MIKERSNMRFGTWNYVREIKQTGEVYIKEMIVLKQGRC